jgi:hypothetical protein
VAKFPPTLNKPVSRQWQQHDITVDNCRPLTFGEAEPIESLAPFIDLTAWPLTCSESRELSAIRITNLEVGQMKTDVVAKDCWIVGQLAGIRLLERELTEAFDEPSAQARVKI